MNHLCRTSLRNSCHRQQWMLRMKTSETMQVMVVEWLAMVKAERKPLPWQREPSALKQLHWLAFGMCEQCMSQVGWRRSLLKLDFLGVSESRWTSSGRMKRTTGETVLYPGREDDSHHEGVAIIMHHMMNKVWRSSRTVLVPSWNSITAASWQYSPVWFRMLALNGEGFIKTLLISHQKPPAYTTHLLA